MSQILTAFYTIMFGNLKLYVSVFARIGKFSVKLNRVLKCGLTDGRKAIESRTSHHNMMSSCLCQALDVLQDSSRLDNN